MPDFRRELSEAAQTGDTARLRALLDGSPALASMPDDDGYTPLHYAAYFGHLDAARYLVSLGADVHAVSLDPLRNTPLHAAAGSGHRELVRLLLEAGADLEARQTGDWTPLHAAAERGHAAVVALLLERGADRTAESVSGKTPLALAREKGHRAVVALLDADR